MSDYLRPNLARLREGEFAQHVRPGRSDDQLIIDLVARIFSPRPPWRQFDPALIQQLLDRAPRPEAIGVDDENRALRADEEADVWGAPLEGPDTRGQWLDRADEIARAWGRALYGPGGLLEELEPPATTE